jgi:hypothetical protein
VRGVASIVALVAGCAQILDIHDRGGANGGSGDNDAAGSILPAFPVGSPAIAIAAADFNGDTSLDLAIGADSAFVAINRGDGTFETPLPYELGVAVTAIATAFVNGDTIPDLLVGNASLLTIYLGSPSGMLTKLTSFPLAAQAFDISTGDYADSSFLSITVGETNGQIAYLANVGSNGSASDNFQPSTAGSIGTTPAALASTVIGSDGHSDLIIADSGDDNIVVEMGNDDEYFFEGTPYPMPTPTNGLVLADVNGDGRADIVAAATTNEVTLLIGQVASPYYVVGESFTLPSTPVAVATGDVNHDGFADIVTADGSANTITVLLGDGTGHFATPKTIPVAADPVALVVGDFNGDQIDDVAVACAGANGVSLVFGPL